MHTYKLTLYAYKHYTWKKKYTPRIKYNAKYTSKPNEHLFIKPAWRYINWMSFLMEKEFIHRNILVCVDGRLYCHMRTRRALSIFKDVLLRTRRALSLYKVYGDSTLLVLNGTYVNSDSALLVLKCWYSALSICGCKWWGFLFLTLASHLAAVLETLECCPPLSAFSLEWTNRVFLTSRLFVTTAKSKFIKSLQATQILLGGSKNC